MPSKPNPQSPQSPQSPSVTPAHEQPRTKRRSPRIYKNRRGELRRDEIFEMLQCSLGTWGWDSVNLRQIADSAGVSVGLIHHHFASRDEIARSFYEDVCFDLAHYFDDVEPAPFATVFRRFVAFSVEQHAFLDGAYADAVRYALRMRRPLPALDRVFARLVERSNDLDVEQTSTWLLEAVHHRLIESFMFTRNREATLKRAEAVAPMLLSIWKHPVAADLRRIADQLWLPTPHAAGTPWHDERVSRSLAFGIPSRNPKRKRDARRRAGPAA